jgi:hypothetical protein
MCACAISGIYAAGNAARAGDSGAAYRAAAASAVAALVATAAAPAPWWWAVGATGCVVGVAGAVRATGGKTGRAVPQHTAFEILAIGGGVAVGATIALAGGAGWTTAALLALLLWTWEVMGLWWIRGHLAGVLRGREPWDAGRWLAGASWLALGLVARPLHALEVALIPALYAARVALSAPAASGADARRVGVTEAAWTLVAAALAVGVLK